MMKYKENEQTLESSWLKMEREKDFIWDDKHKIWVDVRVNNPKLKKLMKEAVRFR